MQTIYRTTFFKRTSHSHFEPCDNGMSFFCHDMDVCFVCFPFAISFDMRELKVQVQMNKVTTRDQHIILFYS